MLGKRVLVASDEVVVAVSRYAPGERHGPHTDRHSRVSFLVCGGYREESRAGAVRVRPGDVLLKATGASHEDQFGDEGARIAAIEFLSDDPFDQAPDLWRRRADALALRHASAIIEAAIAGDAQGARTAGADLVAASTAEDGPVRDAPPWLARLKQHLEEQGLAAVDVTAEARAAGVHPGHVSRLFRRCYGVSITEHAQAHSVRRAFGPLAKGESTLCDVALAAGFYDQSHMTRVFRRVTGRTPGAHRALLAAAG